MHTNSSERGFSLVQVSIMVAVAGVILAATLPGGGSTLDSEKQRITIERMQKIDEAMQAFSAKYYRLPCPADGTKGLDDGDFGVMASASGDCAINGAIKANLSDLLTITSSITSASTAVTLGSANTNLTAGMLVYAAAGITAGTRISSITDSTHIVLDTPATATNGSASLSFSKIVTGGVPTKTLNLPDEYGFDGYGRRMMYTVDNRATAATSCQSLQGQKLKGDIKILKAYNATQVEDSVMWALMSYGKDGHGAFPMEGSTLANRIDTGNIDPSTALFDPDQKNNAFAASGAMSTVTYPSLYTTKLVKKEPTSGFDDIVWYQNASKNTCCTGNRCFIGTHIKGNGFKTFNWNQIATGDLNGDGIQDIIVPANNDTTYEEGAIYVIFGKRSGWLPALSGNDTTLESLVSNGQGFVIDLGGAHYEATPTNPPYLHGLTVATGDIDADGIDDLVISSHFNPDDLLPAQQQLWVILGRTAWNSGTGGCSTASVCTLTTMVDGNTSTGKGFGWKTIDGATDTTGAIAVGDINGDGYKDIVVVTNTTTGYIILGRAIATWSTAFGTGGALACAWAATGPACDLTSGGAGGGKPDAAITSSGARTFTNGGADINDNSSIAIGNINGDIYDDIILTSTDGYGHAYILFGAASYGLGSIAASIDVQTAATDVYSSKYDGGADYTQFAIGVKAGDVNDDGYKDLLFSSSSKAIEVLAGRTGAWAASVDIFTAAAPNKYFIIDHKTNAPSDSGLCSNNCNTNVTDLAVADINSDGLSDILIANQDYNPTTYGSDPDVGTGVIYVFPQPSEGWKWSTSATGARNYDNPYGLFGAGVLSSDLFFQISSAENANGTGPMATADVNADGKTDLIIGANRYPVEDDPPSGMIWILYGRKNVPWNNTVDNFDNPLTDLFTE